MKTYTHSKPFQLEKGGHLSALQIAYHTYGKLNTDGDNVVWICHALTANSDAAEWWNGLVGEGKIFDPNKYFIVCANILGSCYGTTGPLSNNPETNQPYYHTYPAITVRDMVQAQILLRKHLKIEKINIAAGGSLGGFQVLEWAIIEPGMIEHPILIAANARQSPWAIGFHAAQRRAIELDPTWQDTNEKAGLNGLKLARAIGMLTYRHYDAFQQTQMDEDDRTDNFKAVSYLDYQGEKLVKRFNAFSYHILSKAMDTHNIGRDRRKIEEVLHAIEQKTLIIGISSDNLCPLSEQKFLAKHIPSSTYYEINSPYGHDGFLIEYEQLTNIIAKFGP